MAVKPIIDEISEDIKDVIATSFTYSATVTVPNSHDAILTFERGTVKRGKELTTCVLYVDIRNSVALTAKHQSETMGKLYTAFIKAVIKIGRHHKASTRNIIGDRVMLVFPTENCFINAVNCAISINHLANHHLKTQFKGMDFKCGIGIDYGLLKVIKVGIQRNGTEQSENKGLVWTGKPANLASRLTDLGNKKVTKTTYEVKYHSTNYGRLRGLLGYPTLAEQYLGLSSAAAANTSYNIFPTSTKMTEAEFASSITVKTDGTLEFNKGKLISAEKKSETIDYPAILFTERVFDGLKRTGGSLTYWKEIAGDVKDVDCKVYGGGVFWDI